MAAAELARLNAALQAELVAIKAETTAKVTSLDDTIATSGHAERAALGKDVLLSHPTCCRTVATWRSDPSSAASS
jgi:hypothetical protein